LPNAANDDERAKITTKLQEARANVDVIKRVVDVSGTPFEDKSEGRERAKRAKAAATNTAKAKAKPKPSLAESFSNTGQEESNTENEVEPERLLRDFVYFCAHCFIITYRPGLNPEHPFGGFGPFILSEGQRRVMAVFIQKLLVLGEPLRAQILKTRQLGNTTLMLAFAVWLMLTNPHYHVMMIIDKNSHNMTKRNMVVAWLDFIAQTFPHVFPKGKIKKGGRKDRMLELENGSKIFFESAESPNPGTSEMIHFLIESEKPKWPAGRAELVRTSVIPGIPRAPMTVHVDESTAHGIDPFKRKWDRNTTAKKGTTDVLCIFLPWLISNEYREEPTPDCWAPDGSFIYLDDDPELNDYDEDLDRELVESEYAEKYGADFEQIYWRRRKIKSDFDGDRGGFDQEYPTTPSHAYRRYQLGFFPASVHKFLKDETGLVPFVVGELYDLGGYTDVSRPTLYSALSPGFRLDRRGTLFVREKPKRGKTYFVGADSAEGKVVLDDYGRDDPDYTVFSVKDEIGRTVALYISRVRAEHAWYDLVLLAMWYNNAWVNGETNNTGLTLLAQFWLTGYPNNVIQAKPRGAPARDRAWTYTSTKNRGTLLTNLRKSLATDPSRLFALDIEEGPLRQYCNFVIHAKTGKPQAADGFHDDIPLAEAMAQAAIAWKYGDAYASDMHVEEQPEPEVEPVWADEVVAKHGGFRLEDTNFSELMGYS